MIRRAFLFVLLGVTCGLAATEQREALSTPIANAYLDYISRDLPQLSDEVSGLVGKWLCGQPELISRLVIQNFALADADKQHEANQKWLKDLEKTGAIVVVPARSNYVFKIPGIASYVIWVSGAESRVVGSVVANGFWPNKKYWDSNPDLNKLVPAVTYQTISPLVMYHLYLKAGQKKVWRYFYLPKIYVKRVADDGKPLNDKNSIVIQEELAIASEEQFKKYAQNITEDQLGEVLRAIFECGLWATLHSDQRPGLVFLQDGRLALVSLIEQPNVTNPLKGFYLHDPVQWRRNIDAGVNDLKKWLKKYVTDEKRQAELLKVVDDAAVQYCGVGK